MCENSWYRVFISFLLQGIYLSHHIPLLLTYLLTYFLTDSLTHWLLTLLSELGSVKYDYRICRSIGHCKHMLTDLQPPPWRSSSDRLLSLCRRSSSQAVHLSGQTVCFVQHTVNINFGVFINLNFIFKCGAIFPRESTSFNYFRTMCHIL